MSRCNTCGGKKKVKGMGMMNMDCPDCKATGLALKPKPVLICDEIMKPRTFEKKKGLSEYGK